MNIGILEEIVQTAIVYIGPYCPYRTMAKRLLQAVGVKEINEIRTDGNLGVLAGMQQLSGQRNVPQIFIGDTYVGGFTDLYRLQQEDKLDELSNP